MERLPWAVNSKPHHSLNIQIRKSLKFKSDLDLDGAAEDIIGLRDTESINRDIGFIPLHIATTIIHRDITAPELKFISDGNHAL